MEKVEKKSSLHLEDKQRILASVVYLVVSIVVLFLLAVAFKKTGSEAIYSDALETIVNVVAAGILIFVIYYAAKPADEDHPYGHGKIELFSVFFEGGLISFASIMIIIEAVNAIINQKVLHNINEGITFVTAATVINLILGLWLRSFGKKKHSEALMASGLHVLSDVWTSVGVVVGLLLVQQFNIFWLDPAVAIIIAVFLLLSGIKIVKKSIGGLLDEESAEVLNSLAKAFEKSRSVGVIQIHHVKTIRSGRFHHIDAHLVVPEYWNVEAVHKNISSFEKRVIDNYHLDGELHFHLDPCRKAYCKVCSVEDCPIRKEKFEKQIPFDISHLRSLEEPEEFS